MDNLRSVTNSVNDAAAFKQAAGKAGKGKGLDIGDKMLFSGTPTGEASLMSMTAAVKKTTQINKTSAQKPIERPYDRAIVISKLDDESFIKTSKIPCSKRDLVKSFKDETGREMKLFPSSDENAVNVIDNEGEISTQVKLPPKQRVGQVELSPDSKSIYVRTGEALHLADPSTGKIKKSIQFSDFGFNRKIFVKKNGDLLLGTDEELKTLDRDLNEKSSVHVGFTPEIIKSLPGDHMVAVNDGCPGNVLIIDKNGKTLAGSSEVKLHSPIITDEGKVVYVSGDFGSAPRKVNCFDSRTGKFTSFETTKNAQSAIPLKNGDFLVHDDHRAADHRYIMYDKDGKAKWHFKFENEGFVRQFYITEDETRAYVCLEKCFEDDSNKDEDHLYMLKLDGEEGGLGSITGMFSSKGPRRDGKILYKRKNVEGAMTPAILDNGDILLMDKTGIKLLNPRGKQKKRYKSLDEAYKDLPKGVEAVNRRFHMGGGSARNMDAGLVNLLESGKAQFRRENPSAYIMPAELMMRDPLGYSESDKTVNISKSVDEKEAFGELDLTGKKEYLDILNGNTLLNHTLAEKIDMPFPNDDAHKPAKASVYLNKIEVETKPASGSQEAETVRFDINKDRFTTALPVSTGKNRYVFAGANGGVLHWYDVNNRREKQAYDLGSGIKKIVADDKNRIMAVTKANSIFVLEPRMESGEQLIPSDANEVSDRISGTNVKDPDKAEVVNEDDFIIIDGVKLPKKKWDYIRS